MRTFLPILLVCALFLAACAAPSPATATEIPQVVAFAPTWTPRPTRTPIPPPTKRAATDIPIISTELSLVPSLTPAWLKGWILQSPSTDPVTFVNRLGIAKTFSYREYYQREIKPCTRLLGITPREDYIYFSLDTDCTTNNNFRYTISVFRLEVSTGNVTETLPAKLPFPERPGTVYSVSISPDTKYFAYIDGQKPTITFDKTPLTLIILNLRTGEKLTFALDDEYYYAGDFYWSSDNEKILFFLSKIKSPHLMSIRFMDLKNQNDAITFVQEERFGWKVIEFTSREIWLLDSEQNTRVYNLQNSRFISVMTPTATPK